MRKPATCHASLSPGEDPSALPPSYDLFWEPSPDSLSVPSTVTAPVEFHSLTFHDTHWMNKRVSDEITAKARGCEWTPHASFPRALGCLRSQDFSEKENGGPTCLVHKPSAHELGKPWLGFQLQKYPGRVLGCPSPSQPRLEVSRSPGYCRRTLQEPPRAFWNLSAPSLPHFEPLPAHQSLWGSQRDCISFVGFRLS